jgi:sugar O-acyltransferase (sialic acid O-acetyltransferase NeuD family)
MRFSGDMSSGRADTHPRRLLLIGAGGMARETIELIHAVNRVERRWEPIGVLDDSPGKQGTEVLGLPVLGPCEMASEVDEEVALLACVASPDDPPRRARLVERLGLPDARYATLIHPTAVVPGSATIGPGSILHAHVVLTADVTVGAHVAMMPQVVLTHDDRIGDCVTFGAGARVSGGVTIEPAAYIASGAMLRERITVGAGAVVGMGAVATRSVPDGEVWHGCPARPAPTPADQLEAAHR